MQMRLEGVLKQKQQLMSNRQQLDVAAKQIEIQIQAKLREASMLGVTARQQNNAMGLAAAAAKQQQAQIEWGNATRDYAAKNLALQTEYSKLEAQEYQLNLQMSSQGGAAAPGAAPNSWQQAPSLEALRAAAALARGARGRPRRRRRRAAAAAGGGASGREDDPAAATQRKEDWPNVRRAREDRRRGRRGDQVAAGAERLHEGGRRRRHG